MAAPLAEDDGVVLVRDVGEGGNLFCELARRLNIELVVDDQAVVDTQVGRPLQLHIARADHRRRDARLLQQLPVAQCGQLAQPEVLWGAARGSKEA